MRSALHYHFKSQYRYKLEPYEKKWIEISADNRIARYTNLSPGRYTFSVIGSNNDGVWTEEVATIVIVIAPPWWKTWWAYSLYGIVFAGLLVAARRNIIHRERLTSKLKLEHLELEKAQEIDKVKTNFFANISHEFRTPITLILGPLKDLYSNSNNEDQKKVLRSIMRNGERLLRLINQLLDFSKLEAGKMTLQASQTDLVLFLKEIASNYESFAADKKIRFFFYPETLELRVYIDHEKMEKVVHNLLSNAIKFTNDGGEIILNLKAEEKHCSIVVMDTGIGVPADQLDKIFDRFYQVDSSQTREHEGTGVGMALAKELVELHHGTISVESLEGKGTTFTVPLPRGREHLDDDEIIDTADIKKSEIVYEDLIAKSSGEIEKSTVTADGHQPILLIVEDNADMRHYIRKTFSDYYKVIEAANGKEGIMKAEEIIPILS